MMNLYRKIVSSTGLTCPRCYHISNELYQPIREKNDYFVCITCCRAINEK